MYQRRIIVYAVSGPLVMQEVAETWFVNVKRILTTWSPQLPYLAIHDLTNANVTITPYIVSSIRDLYNLRPELTQRIGIVVPRTLTAQLLKVLVRNRDRDTMQTQFFNTRDKAVSWMLDYSAASSTT